MAAGRITTKERVGLLGGFAPGSNCSHDFVDVDFEGIFNMVVAKYEKCVILDCCKVMLMFVLFCSKTPVYPEVVKNIWGEAMQTSGIIF